MASTPQRVSGLAVASLVCGLLCCLPGVGAIGAVLGVGGLMGISRSQGRLTGSGFAATGIALGVLGTIFWIGLAITGRNLYNATNHRLLVPMQAFGQALRQGDYAAARTHLAPSASISDEQFKAFSATLKDRLGAYKGISQDFSIMELMENGEKHEATIKDLQNRTNLGAVPLPVPLEFEKGQAYVFILAASQDFFKEWFYNNKSLDGDIANLVIRASDGVEIWLIEPTQPPATGTPSRGSGFEIPDQDPEMKPKAPAPVESPGTPPTPKPTDPR